MARRYPLLIAAVVAVGTTTAVGTSLTVDHRYQAAASLQLTRTKLGLELPATISRRVDRISQHVTTDNHSATVEVRARPGDAIVLVYAIAATPDAARQLANDYAAELLALDRRIDVRAVDEAEFVAARDAMLIKGPKPLAHGAGALAVSSLFALALARLLDVLPRRRGRRAGRFRA